MRVLLDTHAIVWWLLGDDRLSAAARMAVSEAREVIVSAASAWELSTKARLGKWPEADELARDLGLWVSRQRMTALDVTMEHGARAGNLPGPHRDPSTACISLSVRPRTSPSSAPMKQPTATVCGASGSRTAFYRNATASCKL